MYLLSEKKKGFGINTNFFRLYLVLLYFTQSKIAKKVCTFIKKFTGNERAPINMKYDREPCSFMKRKSGESVTLMNINLHEDKEKEGESEEHSYVEQAQVKVQREQPKFVILHYSPFKAVWDWIILLLVLYTAVFTPYVVAFELNDNQTRMNLNKDSKSRLQNAETSKADPLVIIDLIVDLMFIADILINFRTTYLHNGEVVTHPQRIAIHYVKGWFVIDVFAAVPFDLLLFGSGNSDTMTITGVLKIARLLRLLRVLRRIEQFAEYGAAVLMLLMVTFTLIGHWLACIFYAIAYVERPHLKHKIGWLDTLADKYSTPINDSLSGPSIRSRYITSLYFTFTSLTSIGFGNVAPNTNAEKIFSIFAMLLGCNFTECCHFWKRFVHYVEVVPRIRRLPRKSFQYKRIHQLSSSAKIVSKQVLKGFPECLQADICLHLNRNLLNNCTAFKGASPGKDDIFGADMKDTGASGKSLYFVRALSYCDINKIEMEDLKEILQTYSEFAEEFIRKSKIEDETLRFIRQKRPRLQCKRRMGKSDCKY
ncbi:hypothetical protein KUTeg_015768 [Tegillarca granosa]|uniref:Ion transport domain-containing protein n=1 Tax=Tegillarca granosa TaxID=220873 RepID=A0ABQ9EN86_TEGGR|nr:hypothetical protein KUTeg_015768 [Tegillarca granosa]